MKSRTRAVFYVLIFMTLAFIWGHSCLSREASGNESDAVRELLEGIIGTEGAFARFVGIYIRKIAHFTEFAVLGVEMTLLTYLTTKSGIRELGGCVAFGPIVAVIDETIQIFSGRGSSLFDIMIDTCGYLSAFLVTSLLYFVICNTSLIIRERSRMKNV